MACWLIGVATVTGLGGSGSVVTGIVAVALVPPTVTVTIAVPPATAATTPALTGAIEGAALVQGAELVTFWVLPSLYVARAARWKVEPAESVAAFGSTTRPVTTGDGA